MILALTSWTAGGYGSGPQRTQQRSEFSLQIGEDQVNTSVAICLNHLNRLNWICSAADLNLKSTLIQSNPIQTNYSNQNQFKSVQSHPFQIIQSHQLINLSYLILTQQGHNGSFFLHIAEDHPRPIQHMGSRGRGNVTLPDG